MVRWEFIEGQCFAYKGISMMGAIDRYECGVIYRVRCWIEELGIQYQIDPEITGCVMHSKGRCSGRIHLFFPGTDRADGGGPDECEQ